MTAIIDYELFADRLTAARPVWPPAPSRLTTDHREPSRHIVNLRIDPGEDARLCIHEFLTSTWISSPGRSRS
jgi:hypothetical protein